MAATASAKVVIEPLAEAAAVSVPTIGLADAARADHPAVRAGRAGGCGRGQGPRQAAVLDDVLVVQSSAEMTTVARRAAVTTAGTSWAPSSGPPTRARWIAATLTGAVIASR
jgi:hypothetical protein